MQAARREHFQLEQVGRLTRAEAKGGGAALEAQETLGLKLLEGFAPCQKRPVIDGEEGAKATLGSPLERTEGCPRFQHGAWRQQGAHQSAQSLVLLGGLGARSLEVGQSRDESEVHRGIST